MSSQPDVDEIRTLANMLYMLARRCREKQRAAGRFGGRDAQLEARYAEDALDNFLEKLSGEG